MQQTIVTYASIEEEEEEEFMVVRNLTAPQNTVFFSRFWEF
jgi:hypothetical protein